MARRTRLKTTEPLERRQRVVTHIMVERRVVTVGPVAAAFAKAVRRLRLENGQTQEDIAQAIGFSRPSVVNIELGRQRVYLEDVWKWAEALRVTPAGLFSMITSNLNLEH